MVNHPCPNCGEVFNKKSTYDYHINRKRPCKKITPEIKTIAPEIKTIASVIQTIAPTIVPEIVSNIVNNKNIPLCMEVKTMRDVIENKKKFICKFCNHDFMRKFNLERHLNGRCKLKQEQQKDEKNEEINEEINKEKDKEINNIKLNENNIKSNENNIKLNENNIKLDEKNKIEIESDEKYNLILKRLTYLENENKKLKNKIKKTNKTTNININQNNNIINQNNILINFNDLKLEDVDKKLFTNPLLNSRLQGKFIILQMIENVYINETHPEYQNIMITDKNMGYVKIYNNGKWKTDNIETINMIIDGIISHSKNILIELKQQYVNNYGVKNRLVTSEKYVNLCDLEYLEDLKDEQEQDNVNNKDRIKRCETFREMVYKDTINLFHDNKKTLLKQKNNKVIEVD